MKKLSKQAISEMKTVDVISGLRARRFSILQSLGFRKLRAEMKLTGLLCRLLVFFTGLYGEYRRTKGNVRMNSKSKKRFAKVLRKAAPAVVYGNFPYPDAGLVFGFNHPSLGEILRFCWICLLEYRFKRNLFPVNLPWYEALMPVADELESVGICITPIITPSTRAKMAKTGDAKTMAIVDSLATGMNSHYMKMCAEFIRDHENIWLAPSATRQATVFQSKACADGDEAIKPQTMSLIVASLTRSKVDDCRFVPIAIEPPRNGKRGLNLFKEYSLIVSEPIDFKSAKTQFDTRMKCGGRLFEYHFLDTIALALKLFGSPELVYPGNRSTI